LPRVVGAWLFTGLAAAEAGEAAVPGWAAFVGDIWAEF
jgi:hypothetical protein